MDPLVLRSIERILVVLCGGLSIYCGYRTFIYIPNIRDAEGKIQLPGDVSIYVSRVGPGVFFALFGALVVGASFYFPLQIQTVDRSLSFLGESTTTPSGAFVGEERIEVEERPSNAVAAPESQTTATFPSRRVDIWHQIELLNATLPAMRAAVPPPRDRDVDDLVRDIKLQLMWSVWTEDWGDRDVFLNWAKFNGSLPNSDDYARARRFFELGLESDRSN